MCKRVYGTKNPGHDAVYYYAFYFYPHKNSYLIYLSISFIHLTNQQFASPNNYRNPKRKQLISLSRQKKTNSFIKLSRVDSTLLLLGLYAPNSLVYTHARLASFLSNLRCILRVENVGAKPHVNKPVRE